MLIPSGFGQINWIFASSGAPLGAEVTCGCETSDFVGTPTEAAEAAFDAWDAGPQSVQQSTIILVGTRVKFGPTATGPTGEFAGNLPGGLGGSGVSAAVSLLVAKTTSFGGRAGRGRMFMPGMTEADVGPNGVVDSAYLGAAQTAFDTLHTALNTANLQPVLLHSETSPLSTPTIIDAFVVQGTVATQRRRQRK
jgi:hypothetical protein